MSLAAEGRFGGGTGAGIAADQNPHGEIVNTATVAEGILYRFLRVGHGSGIQCHKVRGLCHYFQSGRKGSAV